MPSLHCLSVISERHANVASPRTESWQFVISMACALLSAHGQSGEAKVAESSGAVAASPTHQPCALLAPQLLTPLNVQLLERSGVAVCPEQLGEEAASSLCLCRFLDLGQLPCRCIGTSQWVDHSRTHCKDCAC